ncbi:hypothetical protein BV898_18996 [Hypsibius exemplaris]|uniref:Uncharacterized protein n=1 Tax=Hypsibius exemplaris TaxID=2072580 RepID=A0A9X6NPZ4_HYPEX|nr:hypothetical protein BV898_18996 [Hypsibius exemplaris]
MTSHTKALFSIYGTMFMPPVVFYFNVPVQEVHGWLRKSLDSHDRSAGLKGKRVPLSDKKKIDSRVAGKTVAGVTQAQPPYSLPPTKPVPTVLEKSTCENRGSSSCTAANASPCFTASGATGTCQSVVFPLSYLYDMAELPCCKPIINAADTCRSKGFTPCTKPILPAGNDPVCNTGLAVGRQCSAVGNMFCCM